MLVLSWLRRPFGPRPFDVVDLALEAAAEVPGCVICSAARRATERSFDALLWELVNDPAVRGRIREALGFCPRHTWELVRVERTRTRNVLGKAILFEDIIRHVSVLLRNPQPRRALTTRPPCPACVDEREAERTYLERVLQLAQEGLSRHVTPPTTGSLCSRHLAAAAKGQLADDLAGFIDKQRWDVATPLTPAERASVRAAAGFLGGECVVLDVEAAGP
ncbi:hypothetical protein LIP_2674 [Limnochorda pilosa]|uniref:Uncharacterized protein n=2 Tax=Limnochorda pilosa TaxID=1555112 RepID=A0A0K2SNU5_LIMPI|nr:hypothetical protein LIP_2674 [Limnochorda pilosa]